MSRITKRDLILSLEDAGRTPAEIAWALETTEAYVRAVEDAEQSRTIPPDPAIYRDLLAALKAYAREHDMDLAETAEVAGIAPSRCDCCICVVALAVIARAEGER